jgi:CRP-like cAMP-binding protein
MTALDTVAEALQRMPLFAGLPEDHLRTLASATLQQRYARGQTIFSRGDPGDRAFVILQGAIDLVIESADGRELILTRLEPGEHFGEMALVDDLQRSASARAAAPSELIVVLRRTFVQALEQEPEMTRHIIRSLVQRLRAADEKIEAFAYLDAEGRIARTLSQLDQGRGESIRISHEELSHMSATSRQTTTRILGEWQDSDFVGLSRRGIVVKDVGALEAISQL